MGKHVNNFNVGDRFEVIKWLGMDSGYIGNIGTVVKKFDDCYNVTMDGDENANWASDDRYMKPLVAKKPTNVDVVEVATTPTKQKKDKTKNVVHFMIVEGHAEYITVHDSMGNIVQDRFPEFVPEDNLTIIENGTTTIVIDGNGTKGVAKLCEGDVYDRTKGFQIAYSKLMIKRWEKMLKKLSK